MVEKKQIVVKDLDMDYLVLQGLLAEEQEVFTEFGKGLAFAYVNSNIKKSMPVVPMEQYKELLEKYNELKKVQPKKRKKYTKKKQIKKKWWQKS